MTDIALSIKPPAGEEDKNLVAHPVARDGLCMIVHKDDPVEALSDDQLRDIFEGKVGELEGSRRQGCGAGPPEPRRGAHLARDVREIPRISGLGHEVHRRRRSAVTRRRSRGSQQAGRDTYVSIASASTAEAAGSDPHQADRLQGVAADRRQRRERDGTRRLRRELHHQRRAEATDQGLVDYASLDRGRRGT